MTSSFAFANLEFPRPIVQAPMAGGITTPELVAACANAGALASLGAGYLSAEAITTQCSAIRALTSCPFAVNLFVPASTIADDDVIKRARAALERCYQSAHVSMPEAFAELPTFESQFEAMLDAHPAVFSFTFGRLDARYINACRARGIALVGTATSLSEALALEEDGVDAIVLQGEEAGGHRGSQAPEGDAQPLMTLIKSCCARIARTPLIAAGGLMTAADLSRAQHAGASAGQFGTLFLLADEAGTSASWRDALMEVVLCRDHKATGTTRAVSGRIARGIKNAWMDERAPQAIAPYPEQHRLTAPLRKAAGVQWKSFWAGTGAHLCRSGSAAALIKALDNCSISD
ncbi:NAD(P)H-dependent flavin oxidoreductase [Phytohalomonas tamaricis]|uniref:NAD(P)H-dependent flavin oxidoreductase n=1 Tax=Phytohalomonas tamaricis TaxID=2081032 RepID=UPI0021D45BDB|nr:nitronate monooxygenase [Phytohalomonas tamaricis]